MRQTSFFYIKDTNINVNFFPKFLQNALKKVKSSSASHSTSTPHEKCKQNWLAIADVRILNI